MQASDFKVLRLSKDQMKFSAAHFLIFDEHHAERLHGHNYRVFAEFKIPWKEGNSQGFGVDFGVLKKTMKQLVDDWDEYVLLPSHRTDLRVETAKGLMTVFFRDRTYMFPESEVRLLPVVNVSVELLSDLLCHKLWEKVSPLGVVGLRLEVEETTGQSCITEIGF